MSRDDLDEATWEMLKPGEGSPLSAANATGSSQKALRSLYAALLGLCRVVATMPGATRPALDHVAADLWEAGKALGLEDGEFQRPASQWPEGEGKE